MITKPEITVDPDYEVRTIHVSSAATWRGGSNSPYSEEDKITIGPFPPLPVAPPRSIRAIHVLAGALAASALLWYALYMCARAMSVWAGVWL